MRLDPQIAVTAALTAAIGWTMLFAGSRKRMLELRARRRRCPSCGQHIAGRTCARH